MSQDLGGGLVPLKTVYECHLADHTMNVYVVSLPEYLGKKTIDLIKFQNAADIAHLRRFVRHEMVPIHNRALFPTPPPDQTSPSTTSDTAAESRHASRSSYFMSLDELGETRISPVKNRNWRLFVVCEESCISHSDLSNLLSSQFPELSTTPIIRVITVARYGPTSKERADQWSQTHWPTIYKHTNPFGPHPSILGKAQRIISMDLQRAMSIAFRCANEVKVNKMGESIGCVILHRDWNEAATFVAATGDTRYQHHNPPSRAKGARPCPEGNPMCHAVLRAIGIVARKQREANALSASQDSSGIYPINCAICDRKDLDEHYHCDVCLNGQYDLCAGCYHAGRRCWEGDNGDGHELVHGAKCDQKPRRPTPGHWIDAHVPKRRVIPLLDRADEALGHEINFFMDTPLPATMESEIYRGSRLPAGGYLCTNMEIYITHEPCVMCSQAILHSRFDRIVFGCRMPRTGALTAEQEHGLGYGLWWRRELNWRALAWELGLQKDEMKCADVGLDVHV